MTGLFLVRTSNGVIYEAYALITEKWSHKVMIQVRTAGGEVIIQEFDKAEIMEVRISEK